MFVLERVALFRCWRFLMLLQPLQTKIVPICSNGTVRTFQQTKVFSSGKTADQRGFFFLFLRRGGGGCKHPIKSKITLNFTHKCKHWLMQSRKTKQSESFHLTRWPLNVSLPFFFAEYMSVLHQGRTNITVRNKTSTEFHLLRCFVVAWTGHVRHVGCYGLDLPHELIPDPGVVLQQCHSAVKTWWHSFSHWTTIVPPFTDIKSN